MLLLLGVVAWRWLVLLLHLRMAVIAALAPQTHLAQHPLRQVLAEVYSLLRKTAKIGGPQTLQTRSVFCAVKASILSAGSTIAEVVAKLFVKLALPIRHLSLT